MNLQAAVEAIDAAVFAKTGRHLKEVELVLLRGAAQGQTYEQIAKTCRFGVPYLKQAAGPRLWKLISEILGEEVSKPNFRTVLERQWRVSLSGSNTERQQQRSEEQIPSPFKEFEGDVIADIDRYYDWNEAPDIPIFYGRAKELATLEQWIVREHCRLVALVGMGGMGKTALAIKLAQQIQDKFDRVVWRSLQHAPPLQELLADLIRALSNQQTTRIPTEVHERVALLIEHLRRRRYLLILDSVELVMRRGELAGSYREGYAGYGEFLKRIGELAHQSCLVLTSREQPREIAALAGGTLPVRSMQLMGLQEEAREIFRQKNLSETGKWRELIQVYRGNPLALKIAATTIQDLFAGNVDEFLRQNTIVFGDIRDTLDEQFERLSPLEIDILYWLVIECQPISIKKLQANILLPVSGAELIDAFGSLLRRGLIETNVQDEVLFVIRQPVIAEYVTIRLVEQVCKEIQEISRNQRFERIELLRSHRLVNTRSQDQAIEKLQVRLILKPIKLKLCAIFKDEKLIEEQLLKVVFMTEEKSPFAVGYVRENLQNLLMELKTDIIDELLHQSQLSSATKS